MRLRTPDVIIEKGIWIDPQSSEELSFYNHIKNGDESSSTPGVLRKVII